MSQSRSDDPAARRPRAVMEPYASTELPTVRGNLRVLVFKERSGAEHLAVIKGDVRDAEGVPVRVH